MPSPSSPVWRTDTLVCPLHASKLKKVVRLIRVLRRHAALEAAWQWDRFRRGRWSGFESVAKAGWTRPWVTDGSLSVTHAQLVMAQVAGQLHSHFSNVQNSYTKLVTGSALEPALRHQLHSINVRELWFHEGPVVVNQEVTTVHEDGTETTAPTDVTVSPELRQVARCLIRKALSLHRRSTFHCYQFQLDQRVASLQDPRTTRRFDQWLLIGTLTPGERIALPLRVNPHFLDRQAQAQFDQALARAGHRAEQLFEGIRLGVAEGQQKARQVLQADPRSVGDSSALGSITPSDGSDTSQKNRVARPSRRKKSPAEKRLRDVPERNPFPSRFALAKTVRLILSEDESQLSVAVATDQGPS